MDMNPNVSRMVLLACNFVMNFTTTYRHVQGHPLNRKKRNDFLNNKQIFCVMLYCAFYFDEMVSLKYLDWFSFAMIAVNRAPSKRSIPLNAR